MLSTTLLYSTLPYAEAANDTIQKLAEQGDQDAQYKIAVMYATGKGIPANPTLARAWYEKAAKKGHADAQYALASHYSESEDPSELKTAYKWLKKAAEQQHAEAQYDLAVAYENGTGTKKNPKKAFEWMLKAAQQGRVDAQYYVALKYDQGIGTPANLDQAIYWYEKADAQDYSLGRSRLGEIYFDRAQAEKDAQQRLALYQKAAAYFHPEAVLIMAKKYTAGTEVSADQAQAIHLFTVFLESPASEYLAPQKEPVANAMYWTTRLLTHADDAETQFQAAEVYNSFFGYPPYIEYQPEKATALYLQAAQ